MEQGPWPPGEQSLTSGRLIVRRPDPPRHTPSDIAAMLWRRLPWMILTFILIVAIGGVAAFLLPNTYPAHSSLLIRLGQAYVYQPQVGDAARGAVSDNDQVVQSEVEILQSDAVKVRVIDDIGLARLYPALGKAYAAADAEKRDALKQSAMRLITSGLKVATAPGSTIARLTYGDSDPDRAALVLNTLVDEYLRYRKTVLSDRNLGALDQERQAMQRQLDQVDAQYQTFLSQNGVGDFDAEKASLAQLYGQLLTDSYAVASQTAEVDGRLGVTQKEAAAAPAETVLFRDLDHIAQDKLGQLKSDRQDLLSRYQPNAAPVREIDQKIAAQEAFVASGQANGPGARRLGANPIFQTLVTERNQLQAQAASLRDRKSALEREIADVLARRQKLAALDPQYQVLARQRDLLSANLRNLAQREQESQAAQALAQSGDDGVVKVIERAYPPATGKSLKIPVLGGAVVFGLFASVCLGLFLAFLEKGYPTAEAVERAVELPVLVTTPVR
jgi:uncharacterized protein involved in exopolysaccharide biosynthesis